jgi:hypothetical protein
MGDAMCSNRKYQILRWVLGLHHFVLCRYEQCHIARQKKCFFTFNLF